MTNSSASEKEDNFDDLIGSSNSDEDISPDADSVDQINEDAEEEEQYIEGKDPHQFASELKISKGDYLTWELVGDSLVVRKAIFNEVEKF
jgi:hypothetical protein